jgi:DNA-directed RNA polymerase specialized sigma24 family protein
MSQSDCDFPAPKSPAHIFATTHWSVVLQAGGEQPALVSAALEQLCRTYWFPLYAFLRRKGLPDEDAKDLTQQFFTRLLERNDFRSMDARKGKFRTFLLTALTHFLSNERDRAQAAKRGGGKAIFSLDAIPSDQFQRIEPASDLSPDKLFDQRWAMTLLATAVARLQAEMTDAGRARQFEQLKQFLTEDPGDGEYADAARRLESTSQAVAVAVHRMRQRYRQLVRTEVAHTVSSPAEVDEEMRHLYAALNP